VSFRGAGEYGIEEGSGSVEGGFEVRIYPYLFGEAAVWSVQPGGGSGRSVGRGWRLRAPKVVVSAARKAEASICSEPAMRRMSTRSLGLVLGFWEGP
jgi:hypothetical protein